MTNKEAQKKFDPIQASSNSIIDACQNLSFATAMVEQLRGGSFRRLPLPQVTQLIDALLRGVPHVGYSLPENFHVLRGRKTKQSDQIEYFDTIHQFSYKPKEMCIDYGRCHQPGWPIFYGANNLDTVIAEISPEIGDLVHVGVAKLKTESALSITAIGEIDHVRRFNRPLVGDDQTTQMINQLLQSNPEHIRTLLIDAFFADMFYQPAIEEHDYRGTSSLSRLLFDATDDKGNTLLDGFWYPSVAHRGGMNIAIKPQAFDTAFEWEKFVCFEITDYLGFGLYGRKELASALPKPETNLLKWNSN